MTQLIEIQGFVRINEEQTYILPQAIKVPPDGILPDFQFYLLRRQIYGTSRIRQINIETPLGTVPLKPRQRSRRLAHWVSGAIQDYERQSFF